MTWLALTIAGAFEIAWVIAMKYSEGFTKLLPSLVFLVTAWLSFALLAYALRGIPMGTAYAVWTGIGTVGVAVIGMIWFAEPVTAARIGFMALIVVGIVGLRMTGAGSALE